MRSASNVTATGNIASSDLFQPLFEELFERPENRKVGTIAFITFENIRNPLPHYVDRLVHILNEESGVESDLLSSGFIAASKMTVVVLLEEIHFNHTSIISDERSMSTTAARELQLNAIRYGTV